MDYFEKAGIVVELGEMDSTRVEGTMIGSGSNLGIASRDI